jgi:hypothetical protein
MMHKNRCDFSAKRYKMREMIGISHKLAQTVIFSCAFVRGFGRIRVVRAKSLCYNKSTGTYFYVSGE